MSQCKFCNIIVDNQYKLSGHMKKCPEFLNFKNNYLTKEFLYNEYILNKKSAMQIALENNLTSSTIIQNLLNKFQIEKRNISESKKQIPCQEKTKKTVIEKYGTINVLSRGSGIREKMEADVFEKYGVNNVFQLKEIKDKIKNTCIQKYGKKSWMQVKENALELYNQVKEKYNGVHPILNTFNYDNQISKPHQIIINYLRNNNIEFIIEKEIINYSVDIYIPNFDLIIEIYGDYWHANPIKYKKTDIIKNRLVEDIWKYDQLRIEFIKEVGYKNIEIFWENDIKNNFDKIEEKLCQLLKLNQ